MALVPDGQLNCGSADKRPSQPGFSDRIFWRRHVGRRIKYARENYVAEPPDNTKGMSRAELAARAGHGLTELGIWEFETGIAPADSADIGIFAKILRVPPAWFFDVRAPSFSPCPTIELTAARITRELVICGAPFSVVAHEVLSMMKALEVG